LLQESAGVLQIIAAKGNFGGGKSELHRATQGLTALGRKVRNSGTERISEASSLKSGTGDFRGAGGVKTAKLCVKQDQIGKREWVEPLVQPVLRVAHLRLPGQIA